MFTPQSLQQILSNMIQTYQTLSPDVDDMNVGSVGRAFIQTFAVELRKAYISQIQTTADLQRQTGYNIFNFQRLQPAASYTLEQFTLSTAPTVNTDVPQGILLSIPGTTIQFQTAEDFTWPAGSTTESIMIQCTETGSIGNVDANTITQLNSGVAGLDITSVTNPEAVVNGRDLENDENMAQRFQTFIASIHRGDVAALQYGALTTQITDSYGYITEQVLKVQVVEGTGSNTIYIDNGTYNTSTNLVTQCQQIIDGYVDTTGNIIPGYRAAGIPATVIAATAQQLQIAVDVELASGFTLDMVEQTLIDNLNQLVQDLNVGQPLNLVNIHMAVGSVEGVLNFTVTSPTQDEVPSNGVVLQMANGYPTVTETTIP